MLIPFLPLRVVGLAAFAALLAWLSGAASGQDHPAHAAPTPRPAEQHRYFHNGACWSPLVWGAPDGGMRYQRQFASPTIHRYWFGAPYLQTIVAPAPNSYLARALNLKENQIYYRYHVAPGYERWGWTQGVGYAPREAGYSYGPNVYPARNARIVGTPQHPQYSGEATGAYQPLLHFDAARRSPSDRDLEAAEKFIALGDAHFAKGEFNQALRNYRHAAEAAPGFATPHFRQGLTYVASERSDFAASAFRKGLDLDPNWNETRFDLASLLGGAAGQYQDHATSLRKKAEKRTADSDAYFTLGIVHFLKNDDQGAKAYFDAVHQLGGKNAQYLEGFPAGSRGGVNQGG